MRRLKIGSRLTFSFAIIILLMFIGSAVGLWQLNSMRIQAQRLHQIDKEVEAILRVSNSLLILQDRLQEIIQTEDNTGLGPELRQLNDDIAADLDEAIQRLDNSPIIDDNQDNASDETYAAQLSAIQTALGNDLTTINDLILASEWSEAALHLETTIETENQRVQTLVDDLSQRMAAEQRLALAVMEQAQRQALAATAMTGTLILVAAGLLGFVVTRSIARPLAHLDEGAKALARRTFEHRLPVDGNDELTHLSRLFNDTAQQLAQFYTDLEDLVRQRTEALEANSAELDHRYRQLETSIAVGQRATAILDVDTLLDEVVQLIQQRFGYSYIGVFMPDEEGQHVVARAGTGADGRQLRDRQVRLKIRQEGVVGWVAHHRRPLRIDDVAEEERYIPLAEMPDTRSECALPLLMGDTLLGVLDIHSQKASTFRMEDMPVLQALADQIAGAIHNASLYQREKNRRLLAETLYHVGRALSRTLDLPEVLNLILEHLADIVPYDRAAVLLKDHEELEFVATRGFPEEIVRDRLSIQESQEDVFRHIYHTERPLIIADVSQATQWQNIPGLQQTHAWLGVPLIRFDSVIGMLSLSHDEPYAYNQDQARLAVTFAGQAAIALENARLYDKITRFTQQLEDMVRERTEALQEAYIQLEHLDRTKTDFINIAAHELRTPLTVLRGYAQILLGEETIQTNERHQEMILSIYSGAIRLHEVVDSMLDVSKIDSRALTLYPEPLSIHPLVELVRQDFKDILNERRQIVTIKNLQNLPMIEADPDALRKVIYHLLSNAIKYTPDGGRITISGADAPATGPTERPGIELIVSDTGIGIDPDFHELIFTKFYQTGELALHSSSKTNFKGAGPGLGLAIARGIVEAHRGQLWVESEGYDEERCPGSRFHLRLPLRQEHPPAQGNGLSERWAANHLSI